MKTLHATLAYLLLALALTLLFLRPLHAQENRAAPHGISAAQAAAMQEDVPFPTRFKPEETRPETNAERLYRRMNSMDATAGTMATGEPTSGSSGSAREGTAAPVAPVVNK